jgi:hypothetical protein
VAAGGGGGLCREAAIQNSPGALALGQLTVEGAMQVAPDAGYAAEITAEEPKDAPRPPLFLLRPIFPELRRTGSADPCYA